MKKRSIAAKLGVLALALTLMTTSLCSGTLAKYSSTFQGEASLLVAKWGAAAKVTKADGSNGSDVGLVTVGTTGGTFAFADFMSTGIKSGRVSNGKIAPGTDGSFNIEVDAKTAGGNASEVATDYKIYVMPVGSANTIPANFTMKTTGSGGKEIKFLEVPEGGGTPTAVTPDDNTYGYLLGSGTINAGAGGADAVKKVNIQWQWPYEVAAGDDGNDEQDTLDASLGETKIKITVIMVQADPTKTAGV